jgi:curved DNA-binding protein CbpA
MTNLKGSQRPHSTGSVQVSLAPPSLSPAPTQPAPVSASIPLGVWAFRVMTRHAELSRLNHFEVLEVAEDASEEAIRWAFNQMVRKYHPDLLRGNDERLRPLAQEIMCRMGAALRVLENAGTRQSYLLSLGSHAQRSGVRASSASPRASDPSLRISRLPGARTSEPAFRSSSMPSPRLSEPAFRVSPRSSTSGTSATTPDAGTPELAFEAARIQLKRGAIEAAMNLAEQACSAEPKHPHYRALHAWLRVERGELQPGPIADEILATLTWAVRQQRTDLEIRLYRARVLQRLGRKEEAIRDFSVVASMDENNLEAVREVRLHRAREEHAAATSGVLSRFFTRR